MLFVRMTHTPRNGPVAIGYEGYSLLVFALYPIVIVLDYHYLVTATQFILAVQHPVADALVVNVCPFVASRHHDGLVQSHLAIARRQLLNQFFARHVPDVWKAVEPHLWQLIATRLHHTSHPCGIPQDARCLALSQHLAQIALEDVQPIAAQHIAHQCRTLRFAHRWQLGTVAYQHHPTITVVIHKTYQVVHQLAAGKDAVTNARGIGNHRGLVHQEQRVLR